MNVIKTAIPDVLIFEPKVFGDERGFFMESFNQKVFEEAVGRKVEFVQDNHSKSTNGVLRGLHFQKKPHAQGKLVRCITGEVFDVAVDIRPESPTFGKWEGVYLSGENKRQLWIPEGFAHGFLVISAEADLLYKTTGYYRSDAESTILWNDPIIDIKWPCAPFILSEKDNNGISFKDFQGC
ncbi:dTDP-4-dehydrorhamnose 3,5-epimerase [Buttiauxella gaviniae ATCC 51604]|uniref:dTDP-4-dehydrorhamnose 3,5-epimerase n=1 Tax=Buttiauxella gaviniae ATCC 51604 TaxID=1354253 RepID=A0A1B7I4W5_9ENTR|nr:dTDP-4-dehydrorhamnose 3,5-epimerase [Buttiauxella gaviniae]OAT23452.1 dTDP-4-dehydrorhamnose 3,5-epimerase [Buttiauxella gaviniae ATCC 51604]